MLNHIVETLLQEGGNHELKEVPLSNTALILPYHLTLIVDREVSEFN